AVVALGERQPGAGAHPLVQHQRVLVRTLGILAPTGRTRDEADVAGDRAAEAPADIRGGPVRPGPQPVRPIRPPPPPLRQTPPPAVRGSVAAPPATPTASSHSWSKGTAAKRSRESCSSVPAAASRFPSRAST